MDFMRVLDQTVRELKREVNLKVLKVPEIEQKVLDATSDEPWGPHGSALAEIAQATKKFSECQMIMNVLWTRLSETGAKWRHVYKALTVIEYLIGNGSERAVDDILEHSFQISSLSGFEYAEPNGKDVGINVRKKVETLVALLTDKEKIQAVRNKAAATRDKYFGLSSTGITYKSSATSYGSSDRFGGFGNSNEDDSFKYSYKDEHKDNLKSKDGCSDENENGKSKKGVSFHAGNRDTSSSSPSKTVTESGRILSSKSPSMQPDMSEDDFDDFNPRGSSPGGSANTSSKQTDLFGENLVDLMDVPTSTPTGPAFVSNINTHEVDLFADATFVSASSHTEATAASHDQANIDFFASQPAVPATASASPDLFGASDSGLLSEMKYSASEPKSTATFDPFAAPDTESSNSEHTNTKTFDPFAAVPLNNFEESDSFGDFTSHSESATTMPQQNITNSMEHTSLKSFKPAPKKDIFHIKSGIWADSLNRGLIDLNITAPKKVNLADIGIVGGLADASDEKEKGTAPAWHMAGSTVATRSGTNKSGLSSSMAAWGAGSFK